MKDTRTPRKFANEAQEAAANPGDLCEVGLVRKTRTIPRIVAVLLLGLVISLKSETPAGDPNAGGETVPEAAGDTNTLDLSSPDTNTAEAASVASETGEQPEKPEMSRAANPVPPPPAEPSPETSSSRSGFGAFEIIADRNIFNGNRSGQRITSTRITSQQRSVRVDAFSLVGTMVSEKGPIAFFDGTESDFRKAYGPGGRIAGFEIKEIRYAGVRLAQGENTLDLAVGTGLRREDGGLWKRSAGGTAFASGSSSESRRQDNTSYSRSSNGSSSRYDGGSSRSHSSNGHSSRSETRPTSSPAPAGDVNEILKRLMEQREKE